MKSHYFLFTLLSFGLLTGTLAACTTTAENLTQANGNEPQAVLEKMLQADVTSTKYPARLARIDGQAVSPGRRTYLVAPGTHTLSFKLDVDAIREYEPEPGRYKPKPSKLTTELREKQITVTFIAGEHYKFGAEIEDFEYTNWMPFAVLADDLNKKDQQASINQ